MIIPILTIIIVLFASHAYCQSTNQLTQELIKIYNENTTQGNDLIFGYSIAGLMGAFLFGSVGLAAFVYGKKKHDFIPIIIGILLMSYPYFLKGTITIYVVGFILTVFIFLFR